MVPKAGGTVAPVGERDHELQLPPTMQKQPGFFSRMIGTDGDGASFGDRLMMATMAAQNPASAMDYRLKLRKETADKSERQRRNEALKGAYRNGRFDPQAYIEGVGDAGDATDAFDIAKVTAPKAGVDGGYSYTQDPMTGETQWGEQRPMSYSEQLAEERAAELEEYREEMLKQGWARVGQGGERIGLARQREGRIASGPRAGGIPAPPPGFRPVRP